MATFIAGGTAVNNELEKIVNKAEDQLILISPYIRLHHRLASALKGKLNKPFMKLIVVFGKNEFDKSKSLNESDLAIFKSFPDVKIYYEKHLHAKYYANETTAILCSMNLYDYSQNNNIEAGILMKNSVWKNLANNLVTRVTKTESLDVQSQEFFFKVMDEAELVFYNKPEFKPTFLHFATEYVRSEVRVDRLEEFFGAKKDLGPVDVKSEETKLGYCIRTGKQIPFNIAQPFCEEAFSSWKKNKVKDLAEKYCHFSGEASNGQTSFAKPILLKNWARAKELHRF
jgi:hypothetical protein